MQYSTGVENPRQFDRAVINRVDHEMCGEYALIVLSPNVIFVICYFSDCVIFHKSFQTWKINGLWRHIRYEKISQRSVSITSHITRFKIATLHMNVYIVNNKERTAVQEKYRLF